MIKMKAWRADRFGDPAEVLRLVELELPEPPEGCVALRVAATDGSYSDGRPSR